MSRLLRTSARLLYQRVPYIAVFSVSLFVLLQLGTWSYYRFMPASWFIAIQSQPIISSGQVGSTLNLTFCRTTRYPNIDAVGARTYYVILGSKESPAGSYSFEATVAHQKKCQIIPLAPNRHPEQAGTYLSHTDLTFYVDGHKKVLSYETLPFVISDTKQSLEQQINNLQEQIEQLKSQQSSIVKRVQIGALPIALPSTAAPAPEATNTSASEPNSQPPTQTNSSETPSRSATPADGLVNELLQPASGLIQLATNTLL